MEAGPRPLPESIPGYRPVATGGSPSKAAGRHLARTRVPGDRARHSARLRRGSAFLLRRVAVVQRQRVAVGVQADRLPAHARVERIADEADALGLKPLPRDGNVGNL